ncbi:right-handed parallel beta-helix repeat-containing protein [Zoogloea sp.]|uniref:right-handed parallel beta-helix repeat-containing protein n=1 Tax=Zoogloea sp. TaxID=49181 RepID=UPI00261F2815|nr:right-handed parallel beta-helix repeat-containing protein [Zoogloea sp.]MDD3352766.1 glycosyl hydrolase family 28-related protein [Zoogloea sp.]
MDRRNAIGKLLGTALWSLSGLALSQDTEQTTRLSRKVINIQDLGADPSGKRDSTNALQEAINRLTKSGGQIYIPEGVYLISRTLEMINPENARGPAILFYGDGEQVSVLQSAVQSGPLLRIRGVPVKGPISSTFFRGGGMRDLGFDGDNGGPEHDALEVLGWWHAELSHIRITRFSRHGIRAITDRAINANPDFTAPVLFLRSVLIERCGGWGFIDDGGPQGAPAWSWDRCIFSLCYRGGAYIQSSSHSFTKCAFSGCGWQSETTAPAKEAWGLFFDGSVTATSRQWVEGCEFDTNLTAHIGARFLSSSTFANNRFIFNDRCRAGRLCPSAGVQFGVGDARAAVRSVEFSQSIFRFDKGGEAVGFDWVNTANVRDIEIRSSIFSDNSKNTLALTRYRGNNPGGRGEEFGYVIRDRDRSSNRQPAPRTAD